MATTFGSRLLGLAVAGALPRGRALLIPRCGSVHTLGMRFAIDVVFLDRAQAPLAIRTAVPRNRIVCERAAAAVLELPRPAS